MPEATVGAIVTTLDHGSLKVLLTRRGVEPYRGYWCIPGGHIDRYEPFANAVVREVGEETGLEFEARFFGCFDEIIPERGIHAVVLVFEGRGTGALSAQPGEVTEIRWFLPEEARSLPLAFDHARILDAYLTENRDGVSDEG